MKNLKDQVGFVGGLVEIRDRMRSEDTSASRAAADALDDMIQSEGRDIRDLARTYPGLARNLTSDDTVCE